MSAFKSAIAIVTGGTSGIGRGICEELGRRGAMVVVTGRNIERAGAVASGIVAAGGRAEAVRVDVTREEEVLKVVNETVSTHGRVDFMFNNAGFAVRCEEQDMTFEHWRRIVDVNLMGVYFGTHAAYAQMIRQKAGHIVNMSSVSAFTGFPTAAAYSATKAAIATLSVSLRAEGAAFGVKVSVVCPGHVATGICTEKYSGGETDEGSRAGRCNARMTVEDAVDTILAGVEKNRMIIIFPLKSRLKWWLSRIHPESLQKIGRRMTRRFRGRARSV